MNLADICSLKLQPSNQITLTPNNLGQKATLREQNSNLQNSNLKPSNLQHSNLQHSNLGQKATLREQPNNLDLSATRSRSTFIKPMVDTKTYSALEVREFCG
ncbi:MAG: hypothetical protein F6K55_32955 [Moorea sp. SIO4A3]|nr:hypothetical protein [Moorena sp. SIO4A3]